MDSPRKELVDHLRQKDRSAAHSVSFQRNTINGLFRGSCPCGWFMIGEQAEVQSRAATHDMETWEPVT